MIQSTFPPIDLSILPSLALAALARFVDVAEFDDASEAHAAFASEVRAEACRRFVQSAENLKTYKGYKSWVDGGLQLEPDLLDTPAFMAAAGVKQP